MECDGPMLAIVKPSRFASRSRIAYRPRPGPSPPPGLALQAPPGLPSNEQGRLRFLGDCVEASGYAVAIRADSEQCSGVGKHVFVLGVVFGVRNRTP